MQQAKRASLVQATRIFSGADGAPRIVAVLPLSEDVNAKAIVTKFGEALGIDVSDCPEAGVWKMK